VGLNVYFCDVCGVRVTDVDLRSGHGMLRGRDVICATCLDMGHGKEWLASRGMAESAPSKAASGSAPAGAANANPIINYARDRAATIPESTGASAARADIAHEDTSAVITPQPEADFSGAAAGFAALTNRSERPSHDDDGRLDEESSDHVDPVLLHVTPQQGVVLSGDLPPTSPFDSEADDGPAVAPAAAAKAKSSGSSRIVAKPKSDRLRNPGAGRGSQAAAAKSTTKRSSTAASPASSGKASNPKSSKISKSTSSRAKRGGGGLSLPLKVSLITVPLLLILVVSLSVGGTGAAAKQAEVKDLPAQKERIEREFSEVKSVINSAYSSKNLSDMKAANQRWQQFLGAWDGFAKDAQRYSGWTEDQCSSYWEGLRAPDVGARTRLLRDEIAKQSAH
jgi:hypothetical protein